jgi:TolB protein
VKLFGTSIVAAIAVLALIVSGSAPGAFPGRNGWIVFASTTGENVTPQLFSVEAGGTGRKNLTRNHYSNQGGAWSPDGRQIAFCQPDASGFALVVMKADGTGQRRLAQAARCTDGLSWSPDGSLIAYRANFGSDGIHLIRPTGGEERVVAPGAGLGAPVWSPAGLRLAVVTEAEPGTETLTVLDLSEGTRHDLLGGARYANPAWSPDGHVLAYALYTGSGGWEIHTIRLDGTGDRHIAHGWRAVWSPDGRHLAVIGDVNPGVSLTVIDADGSGVVSLSGNTFDNASWSPDGRGVAFVENFRDVYFARADGSGRRRVTHEPSGSRVEHAQWSPDGRRILYEASHAQNDEDLYALASNGGGVRPLTRNGVDDFDPAWSPDGTEIVFVKQRRVDSISNIVVTDAAGKNARVLMVGGSNSSPSWSPDGSQVVFARGSPEDESSRLYVVGQEGSPLRSLGTGSDPAWSPDGKRIAFINGGAMWLMRRDGTHRKLFLRPGAAAKALAVDADAVDSFSAPAWSPDGKSLAFAAYYYPYGPRGDYLAALTTRVDRTHIEPHLWDVEPGSLTAEWSPDGKKLLFGAGELLVQPVNSNKPAALTHLPGWSGYASWQPRCTTYGSARPDLLTGSEGDNVICGLDGNDTITGGRGNDRLFGESGNDRINAKDGAFDVIGCGPGTDTVIADPNDLVGRDCERATN